MLLVFKLMHYTVMYIVKYIAVLDYSLCLLASHMLLTF